LGQRREVAGATLGYLVRFELGESLVVVNRVHGWIEEMVRFLLFFFWIEFLQGQLGFSICGFWGFESRFMIGGFIIEDVIGGFISFNM
jgi:hypothetical protein